MEACTLHSISKFLYFFVFFNASGWKFHGLIDSSASTDNTMREANWPRPGERIAECKRGPRVGERFRRRESSVFPPVDWRRSASSAAYFLMRRGSFPAGLIYDTSESFRRPEIAVGPFNRNKRAVYKCRS